MKQIGTDNGNPIFLANPGGFKGTVEFRGIDDLTEVHALIEASEKLLKAMQDLGITELTCKLEKYDAGTAIPLTLEKGVLEIARREAREAAEAGRRDRCLEKGKQIP